MAAAGGSDASSVEADGPVPTVTNTMTVTAETTATVALTETVTATVAPQPAAELPAPSSTTATQAVKVTVPNGVGKNYQEAQDLWRAAGLAVGVATDATGANRLPILDLNWVVLEQDIAPGTVVDEYTVITATVKKFTDQ